MSKLCIHQGLFLLGALLSIYGMNKKEKNNRAHIHSDKGTCHPVLQCGSLMSLVDNGTVREKKD